MSDFITALAGLAQGVGEGIAERRERQDIEKERTFRLRQYEDDARRAALLDALNEEAAKSRIAMQERALKLDEERHERDLANSEQIPVEIAGETVMRSRAAVEQLNQFRDQLALQQQHMVPGPAGGFISPSEAADLSRASEESKARQRAAVFQTVADDEEARLAAGVPPSEARRQALAKGASMELISGGGSTFGEILKLEEEEAKRRAFLNREPLGSERQAGFWDRVVGIGRGLNPFGGDPIEQLRQREFGPKPPQSLQELQAFREREKMQQEVAMQRAAMAIPPIHQGMR